MQEKKTQNPSLPVTHETMHGNQWKRTQKRKTTMCRESLTQRVNPLGPFTFLNIRAWRELKVYSLPFFFYSPCSICVPPGRCYLTVWHVHRITASAFTGYNQCLCSWAPRHRTHVTMYHKWCVNLVPIIDATHRHWFGFSHILWQSEVLSGELTNWKTTKISEWSSNKNVNGCFGIFKVKSYFLCHMNSKSMNSIT